MSQISTENPAPSVAITDPILRLTEFPRQGGCKFYALVQGIRTLCPQTSEASLNQVLQALNPAKNLIADRKLNQMVDFDKGAIKLEVYSPTSELARMYQQLFDQIFAISGLSLKLRFTNAKMDFATLQELLGNDSFLIPDLTIYKQVYLANASALLGKAYYDHDSLEAGHSIGLAGDNYGGIDIFDSNASQLTADSIAELFTNPEKFVFYKDTQKYGKVFCQASRLPMVEISRI